MTVVPCEMDTNSGLERPERGRQDSNPIALDPACFLVLAPVKQEKC